MTSSSGKAVVRRTPLMEREPLRGRVELMERRGIGKVILRGRSDDIAFTEAAKSALGTLLPLAPNTMVQTNDGGSVFWLGPSEWIIHDPGAGAARVASLEAALEGCFHQTVDVSDYYTVIRLGGPRARAILAQGCPLDLHASVFAVGTVAQSRFAKAPVMIHLCDGKPTFDLQVRWSFADYLWNYLLATAAPETDDIIEPAG